MPRPQGRVDPNQPSPRAMLYIKNRTNINDMRLRRTLESFDRERISSITNIDHDRLDVKDFLKGVKHCASDELPESKLWLGEKNALKKKREEQQRNIFTAPAALAAGRKGGGGGRRGASDETRDVKTAPEQESSKTDSEIVKVGIFFKKKKDVDPNRVHMDIYSKRNMYSTIDRERKNVFGALAEEEEAAKQLEEEERQRKWAEEEERQRKLSEDQRAIEEANKMAVAAAEDRRRSEAVDILTLERAERPHTTASIDSESRRRTGIRAEMRRIAGIGPQTELEKRESRIRAMNDNAELMKEILIKNAKKRAAKKRNKSPLEDRIRTFFTRIEDLRKGEEEVDEATMRMEQQRRYVLMTKGVKAALELKDGYEEEENPYNTI